MSLDKVRKKAIINGYPNLAEFIRTAKEVTDNKDITTCATDGYQIFINPEYVKSIGDDETLGVMMHEFYHIIYNHVERGKEYRHVVSGKDDKGNTVKCSLWNLCADVVVNDAVMGRFGGKLPKGCILRGQGTFKDLPNGIRTTVTIYNWWLQNNPPISSEEIQQGASNDAASNAAEGEQEKGKANGTSDKANGNLPDKDLARAKEAGKHTQDRELKDVNQSADVESWIDLLTAMRIEAGRLAFRTNKRSYNRPARYEPRGLIRPINQVWQNYPKVDVYVDVSGSMSDNPLTIMKGLKSILSSMRMYRPRFFTFDTDIREVSIKEDKFDIGGGTDIHKVLNKITSDKADLAIVITDCEDSITKQDFKENVIVVSNDSKLADYYTTDWLKVKRKEIKK